ncbi:MAG TPA: thiamine phosphate synthase [Terriglobia bacterium]|nr:thiamine phosphate synthase [Terriglobia bacterium]
MPLLYYITDRRQLVASESLTEALKAKVRAAFEAGVDYVQVREKDLDGRALAALVEELAQLRAALGQQRRLPPASGRQHAAAHAPRQSPRLLVNERLDVARACGADGVHLPADSLPVAAVRNYVGQNWIVGAACHSSEEVEQAAREGADYVLVAPVFDTASKPGLAPMGLEKFSAICRRSPVPVFALGGVSRENARLCLEAGAAGLAGIRLFQQAPDLASLCQQLHALGSEP